MRPWLRVGIAGFLGAIAMFIWASIAHMATPLANTGIGQIKNENPLLQQMQTTLGARSGLYIFPHMETKGDAPMKAYAASLKANPSGLLVYRPPGAAMLTAGQLTTEFLSELAQSLIAAVLLAFAAINGYRKRVGFIALVGAGAALTTNLSYWNWYSFPGSYTLAYGGIEWLGYIAAALVIAAVLPRNIERGLWGMDETANGTGSGI